jgi:putative transposase
VDQAGWHQSKRLVVPDNITLMPLPAKAPELNPVENIWQYMRDNWISNRIFASYPDILDHCCDAWNDYASCYPPQEPSSVPTAI